MGKETGLGRPLHKMAELLKQRGFVVIVSDLLGDSEVFLDALKHFRFSGHEVIVFHLLDPQEVDFDFKDVIEFEDMETGEKMLISGEEAQELYLNNISEFKSKMESECGGMGVDYVPLQTNEPLDKALFSFLAARKNK